MESGEQKKETETTEQEEFISQLESRAEEFRQAVEKINGLQKACLGFLDKTWMYNDDFHDAVKDELCSYKTEDGAKVIKVA